MTNVHVLFAGCCCAVLLAAAPASANEGECSSPLATKIAAACPEGLVLEGCCANDRVVWCEEDGSALCFLDCSLSNQACGWEPSNELYSCGPLASAEPSGEFPRECTWTCTGDCTGRECGSDGCFGTCGTCPEHMPVCGNDGQCGMCAPDCAGRQCGEDGCGGSCGDCAGGEACLLDGTCCTPSCDGAECGSDGCGGSCGECTDGKDCTAGQCTACAPDCEGLECGDDGCGGSCGECDAGEICLVGTCAECEPACESSQCGDDGCGGSCGTCGAGTFCDAGACLDEYPAACRGEDSPSGSSCPGSLVPEGCCASTTRVLWCEDGKLYCADCPTAGDPAPTCGWGGESAPFYRCGGSGADPTGTFPQACACTPSCGDKECGDDGCGGSCGTCDAGETCTAGDCVDVADEVSGDEGPAEEATPDAIQDTVADVPPGEVADATDPGPDALPDTGSDVPPGTDVTKGGGGSGCSAGAGRDAGIAWMLVFGLAAFGLGASRRRRVS